MRTKRLFCNILLALAILPTVHASEIEPRSFVNTPVGSNFLLVGFTHSEGGLSTPASSPLSDAELNIDSGVLALARTLDVGGNSAKIDAIFPYSGLSGEALVSGQPVGREVSGLNDPLLRFSLNFVGAPALSMAEFSRYQQDLVIGASLQVSVPVGQYDPEKLVNLGNNRWSVKPKLGLSKTWGALILELSAAATVFTKNDNYFGGGSFEQDTVYSSQVHATYSFRRGLWAALSTTYDYGGTTYVNGVTTGDRLGNSRAGATLAIPLSQYHSLKLYASSGVSIRTGTDFDLVGILWQYRWDDAAM
jgi:hypothetical protein